MLCMLMWSSRDTPTYANEKVSQRRSVYGSVPAEFISFMKKFCTGVYEQSDRQ